MWDDTEEPEQDMDIRVCYVGMYSSDVVFQEYFKNLWP